MNYTPCNTFKKKICNNHHLNLVVHLLGRYTALHNYATNEDFHGARQDNHYSPIRCETLFTGF